MLQTYLIADDEGNILTTITAPYGYPFPYNQAMTKAAALLPADFRESKVYILEARPITEVTGNQTVTGYHAITYDEQGRRVD